MLKAEYAYWFVFLSEKSTLVPATRLDCTQVSSFYVHHVCASVNSVRRRLVSTERQRDRGKTKNWRKRNRISDRRWTGIDCSLSSLCVLFRYSMFCFDVVLSCTIFRSQSFIISVQVLDTCFQTDSCDGYNEWTVEVYVVYNKSLVWLSIYVVHMPIAPVVGYWLLTCSVI